MTFIGVLSRYVSTGIAFVLSLVHPAPGKNRPDATLGRSADDYSACVTALTSV
jgi:hypothetical protein